MKVSITEPVYPPPFGALGLVTFTRTYARVKEPGSKLESFYDTLVRVITGGINQLGIDFTEEEIQDAFYLMYNLKCSVAGRFLWSLGTSTVDRYGLMSLQNCLACVVDRVTAFSWIMDSLMLGCGVGFNVQSEYTNKLPLVNKNVKVTRITLDTEGKGADFIVPDSREGWVKLMYKTIKAGFGVGKNFTYYTGLLRSKGTPIKGFGGIAGGPEPLCRGVENITTIFQTCKTDQLSSTEVMDIVCNIAELVVSGNVRRSALIALGDSSDEYFINAKRWDTGTVPNIRCNSNNSVVTDSIESLPASFWEPFEKASIGECYGLINLSLSRTQGRLGEECNDSGVVCYNPCGEISLGNYESCCLSEIFLPNIYSYEEFMKCMKIVYKFQKHSLSIKCHQKCTEDIVHKNMRLGIGVTGIMQCNEQHLSWLSRGYTEIKEYDRYYSGIHNFPPSIKLTTVKPSGTLSLIAGVTPGIHPGYSQYMIRRIRLNSESKMIPILRSAGYPIEYQKRFDNSEDYSTVVVSFPYSYPEGTKTKVSAIEQLDAVKFMQKVWSDNSVSCTVYYRMEELQDIKEWLKKNYSSSIKTVSFLLHSDHGFAQAPYEAITLTEYKDMSLNLKPLDFKELMSDIAVVREANDTLVKDECASGACPIK